MMAEMLCSTLLKYKSKSGLLVIEAACGNGLLTILGMRKRGGIGTTRFR